MCQKGKETQRKNFSSIETSTKGMMFFGPKPSRDKKGMTWTSKSWVKNDLMSHVMFFLLKASCSSEVASEPKLEKIYKN